MKRFILLSYFCFVLFLSSLAQGWSMVFYKKIVSDTIYFLKKENYRPYEKYAFLNNENGEIFRNYGLNPFHKKNIIDSKREKKIIWRQDLSKPYRHKIDDIHFVLNFFTKNIGEIELKVYDQQKNILFIHKSKISHGLYQVPELISLKDFIPVYKGNEKIATKTNDEVTIDYFEFTATRNDLNKRANIILGDFSIVLMKDTAINVLHPFLLDEPEKNRQIYYNSEDIPFSLFPLQSAFYNEVGYHFYVVADKDAKKQISEKEFLLKIFRECLDHYPFYEERKLDKDSITDEFIKVKDIDSLSFIETTKKLQSLAHSFYDGHFSIKISNNIDKNDVKDSKKISPVNLINLQNRIFIAAVLDTFLSKNLVGAEILKINDIPIHDFFNKNRNTSLKNCLNNLKNSPYTLLIRRSYDTTLITLRNKSMDSLYVALCQPKHRDFRILRDEIGYFRLKNFWEGDYLCFLNYYDHLKKCKGLILDLRGNGGGDSTEGMKLFSLFINKPEIYHDELDSFNSKESLVVKQNSFHLGIPLVVLIDAGTACASEEFISALKNANCATIIGKEKTAGAYACLFTISFPSGIVLKTNVFSNKYIPAINKSIENKGIAPDIWVKVYKVEDLIPYNDKVLEIATNYLREYQKANLKKYR